MVELREITGKNFEAVLALTVNEAQRSFVAPNVFSLAQAKIFPECVPLAVYANGAPAGFVMYALDPDDGFEYWISRVMVDDAQQGKGYGKAAMRLLIDRIFADRAHDRIFISFEPENEGAKAFYIKLGFVDDGRVVEGETVYRLERAAWEARA